MRKVFTSSLWTISAIGIFAILSSDVAELRAQTGSLTIEDPFVRISVFADKGAINEIIHKPSGINLRSRTTGAFRQIWSMNVTASDGATFQVGASSTTTFAGSVRSRS